jgi:hypothetical protein
VAPADVRAQGSFNPVKAFVGGVNVVRGVTSVASGATLLLSGAALTPVGPISAPVTAVGTAKVAAGIANFNRGAQQLGESVDDRGGPAAKNLLGLLPFGQKFDDRAEPGPGEFVKNTFTRFVTNPGQAAVEAVEDFFAIGGK